MTIRSNKWWLSALFLAGYPLIFYIWWWFPNPWIVFGSTGAWIVLAIVGMVRAHSERYFTGAVEVFLYGVVVVDIFAESLCILHPKLGAVHDGHDFWLCAAAFAIVMGTYRWWRLKQSGR